MPPKCLRVRRSSWQRGGPHRSCNKALRIEEIAPDEARDVLGATMPAAVMNMLLDAWAAALGQPAFVTPTVERLTGQPARTFGDWVTNNVSEFLRVDVSAGNV